LDAESTKPGSSSPPARDIPGVAHKAGLLAPEWILMAKSEALEKLGEHQGAESLAETPVRKYIGWDPTRGTRVRTGAR